MNEAAERLPMEPRWPVIVTIVVVICLLVVLPGRFRLFPVWCLYATGAIVLGPIVAVSVGAAKTRWLVVERIVTLLFVAIATTVTLVALMYLIVIMVERSAEIRGLALLTTGVAIWITNVLIFSLLYWQLDRGGPGGRASPLPARPDWLFPQEGAPPMDLPPDWRRTFVDYLFLAYTTATAFSPTDVLPLSARAKMAMMLESLISLVTIVVVAARAINVLGS